MKKIYLVIGYKFILRDKKDNFEDHIETHFGYYSNLKKVFLLLKSVDLPVYSTIARKVQLKKFILLHDVQIKVGKEFQKCNELIIRSIEINRMHNDYRTVNIRSMISHEVFRNEMGLLISDNINVP